MLSSREILTEPSAQVRHMALLLMQVNGKPIPEFKVFGKPHPEPYRLMEGLLLQQAKLIGLDLPQAKGKLPFGAVYAVGDNPASDIAGARAAGM